MTALYPTWTWGDVDLSAPPFAFGFGSDLGAPQTATEALAQLLTDGEIEVSTRASNRTLTFTVYVESVDLLASAEAERLLALEADKSRNTLTFDPGDGYAPATVFETFRAQMSFVRDDDAEMSGLRRYDIVMKASPSGLSVDYVETEAIVGGLAPTITTLSDGTTTTGWSATSGALTDQGSYLRVFVRAPTKPEPVFTAAAPVNLSAQPFVSLAAWRSGGALTAAPHLFIDAVEVPLIGVRAVSAGVLRYFYSAPVTMTAASVFRFVGNSGEPMLFNSLQAQDSLPASGSARQLTRSLEVLGSARTQGSLAVQHETSALGSTLVYTWPSALSASYSPELRPMRVSGGTVTTDTSLVSGARDLLDTALIFDVPVGALITGTHQLMARLRSDTATSQTVNYTAQLRLGSTNVGDATTGSVVVPFAGTPTAWRNVVLARLMLPPTDVPSGSSAVVRVTLVAASAGASNIDLDEAWLFNTSVGDLTWIECGTGTPSPGGPSNRLWLDAATVTVPRSTAYHGYSDDRSDATYPTTTEYQSKAEHTFSPPVMNVFSVTANALDAAVSLRHRPAWQTHAAR